MRDLVARLRAAGVQVAFGRPFGPGRDNLAAARARGVQVTIVTSEHINRLGMKWSIMEACARRDLQLRLLDGTMTHVKALLVDDRVLVLGSANFDFLSGTLQPEVLTGVHTR